MVRICPSLGLAPDGTRFMTDLGGNKLVFNLYSDATRITVWGTWYSKSMKAPSLDIPIGRSQKSDGTATIYARIDPSQQGVAPGVYNSAINGKNSAFAYDYVSKGSCDAIKTAGARSSVPVAITARVGDGGPSTQPIVAPDATDPATTIPNNPQEHRSVWQKLGDNAQYQQRKNQGSAAPRPSNPPHLCTIGDSGAHPVDGGWAGPNCITSNSDGKAAHTDQSEQATDSPATQSHAEYIESHSCMTTLGAEKANSLAEKCTRATSGSHGGCNTQQNTCEEIRDATRHGCDGLGASAPDFCIAN